MGRDYTYISDVVEAIIRVMEGGHKRDGFIHYDIYDIGKGIEVNNSEFIETLATAMETVGCFNPWFDKAYKFIYSSSYDIRDPVSTIADPDDFDRDYGFVPHVDSVDGLLKFAKWYKEDMLK